MSWRDRLDRTTNWAIGAVAAMLSISLSSSVLTGKMNANWTYARSIGGLLTNLVANRTAFNLANYLNQLMGELVLRVSSFIN